MYFHYHESMCDRRVLLRLLLEGIRGLRHSNSCSYLVIVQIYRVIFLRNFGRFYGFNIASLKFGRFWVLLWLM